MAEPRQQTSRGAGSARTPLRDQFHSWFSHHRRSARDSAQRLRNTPLSSLMTGLVMGIALALPTALFLIMGSIQQIGGGWEQAGRLSVYLTPETGMERAAELAGRWSGNAAVGDVTVISRDEAMETMRSNETLSGTLGFLEDNPLPHTLVLTPDRSYREAAALEDLAERLRQATGVDQVKLDLAWLQRLNAMADVLGRATQVLSLLLVAGVVLVISNTVRLAIESRRREIIVARLVGGTDSFVRRPFLYTGVWYGALGGVLAWWLVEVAFWWLSGPVGRLAELYNSGFKLQRPGPDEVVLLLGSALVLGWLGAWWAVHRHLRAVEPD
ncbi:permease-like cell division protein FtsX [Salicola sp. Rm-C-2C1-2]|uniref:permease-like cell division protein FtsX n=1 Tax=Salicola sp. Rm-C-2C1-2 TaxID=3141321 RepID=UPI0032E37931